MMEGEEKPSGSVWSKKDYNFNIQPGARKVKRRVGGGAIPVGTQGREGAACG